MTSVANQLKSQHTLALDANAASATAALELELCKEVFFVVEADTGAHTTHVLTLQMSVDGTNWHNHGSATVTGAGFSSATVGSRYVRVLVTTLEGGASTVDVRINARA